MTSFRFPDCKDTILRYKNIFPARCVRTRLGSRRDTTQNVPMIRLVHHVHRKRDRIIQSEVVDGRTNSAVNVTSLLLGADVLTRTFPLNTKSRIHTGMQINCSNQPISTIVRTVNFLSGVFIKAGPIELIGEPIGGIVGVGVLGCLKRVTNPEACVGDAKRPTGGGVFRWIGVNSSRNRLPENRPLWRRDGTISGMKIPCVTVAHKPAVGQRSNEGLLGRPCPFARREFRGAAALSSRSKGIRAAGTDPEAGTDLFSG